MPTNTQSTVVAVYSNTSDAQAAVAELRADGFTGDNIYVSSDGSASETGAEGYGERKATTHEGGIAGWFKRVFSSDDHEDRPYYENAVRGGRVVVSVEANDQSVDRVADILNRHSPIDVHRDFGESSASTTGTTAGARTTGAAGTSRTAETGTTGNEGRAIPVVEEELKVGKRSILRGGVRVYSRIVEQPVEESVRLREERVTVERQPTNRPVNAADLRSGQDQVIEMKEYAEEPVVSKEARVVEEVRVNKTASERAETVRDTVRHTEVNVENLDQQRGDVNARGEEDDDFRRHFTTNYANAGGRYEDYAPAYTYGYTMAQDPRYKGRDFSEVESDLQRDYGTRYPNSTWERMKDSIRYGWDKVTGRSRASAGGR